MLFFPVDNTRGLQDAGLQAYKAQLQTSITNSASVKLPVPTSLLRFQDMVAKLARAAVDDDTVLMQKLRIKYTGCQDAPVPYLWLTDAKAVYSECLEGLNEGLEELEADRRLKLCLDFLHLQGALTHDNAAELKDLVVIDPRWLLKTLARVIRNPELHPLPVDIHLPRAGFDLLFKQGKAVLSEREARPQRTACKWVVRVEVVTRKCIP